MMKILKWASVIILFLIIGELVIRFDEKTKLFETDNVVKISKETGVSEESILLSEHKLPLNDSDLRILVLGDSYIYGGGIDFNNNFSHHLKSLLKNSRLGTREKIYVLDVSRPDNNNLDNYYTYFKYVKLFKPQLVILGYNLNDIKDNLEKKSSDTVSMLKSMGLPVKSESRKNALQKFYNVLWESEVIKFTSKNFYKYMKSMGIIIPHTGFDEKIKAYVLNESSWIKSKAMLTEMFDDAHKQHSTFVVLLMPEIEMLEFPKLFYATDTIIQNFLKPFPDLVFINGRDIFKGQSSETFQLSKYDGHPNEKGHLFMAKYVDKVIETKPDLFFHQNNIQ